MAKIIIPTALRQYTAQADEIDLAGGTVNDVLTSLTQRYPDLHKHLYNEQNRLRNFVNIYLNDEDVRYLQKGATEVAESDTISIIPAIAGGASASPCRARPRWRRRRGRRGAVPRRDQALQPPPDHARGGHGGAEEAEGGAACC